MRKKYRVVWLTILFAAMLTLAACVRPYPQDEPADTPNQDTLIIQPTIASGTPIATPMDTVVTDPTLEPPQPPVEIVPTDTTAIRNNPYSPSG